MIQFTNQRNMEYIFGVGGGGGGVKVLGLCGIFLDNTRGAEWGGSRIRYSIK